jgi:protein TonB
MAMSPVTAEDRMSDATSPNAHFLAGDTGGPPQAKARLGGSLFVSIATHAAILAILLLVAASGVGEQIAAVVAPPLEVIWIEQPGPGGGGGGSPNPAPVKRAELPKPKIEPLPSVPKPVVELPVEIAPPPPPTVPLTSSITAVPGAITGLPNASPAASGGGGGSGTGVGGGKGSGIGPGEGGGTGGGVYRPGNGVISPRLVYEVKPNYTSEAMRAKIQGIVTMEAVVNPDGSVGAVQIVRSLDQTFGLDQEAIKTVRKWRFAPGTRQGQAVAVLVEIEMTFTLR